MVKKTDPKLDAPILNATRTHDGERQKLDTGMTVGEAINNAAFWWESKGRKLMTDQNKARDNPAFGRFNPNPTTVEEADNWLPSGVLMAKPWVDLTRDEKLFITKTWHHHHVRVPNMDPEEYLRMAQHPDQCFYCAGMNPAIADETLPNGETRGMCLEHFRDRYPEKAKTLLETEEPTDDDTIQ